MSDRIRGLLRAIQAFVLTVPGAVIDWACYEGKWYVGSAVFHAVAILSLALIAVSLPSTLILPDQAPTFDAAEVAHNAAPPPVERFEVGNPPLDPTELNAETLAQTKALPVGGQTAKYYDDSSEFEDAGGGTVTDAKGPKLGGLGGFSVADLPGPAGRGGVGVGIGLGTHAGWGGAGEGFGSRGKGHRERSWRGRRHEGFRTRRRRRAELALSPPERHTASGALISGTSARVEPAPVPAALAPTRGPPPWLCCPFWPPAKRTGLMGRTSTRWPRGSTGSSSSSAPPGTFPGAANSRCTPTVWPRSHFAKPLG